MSFPDRIKSRCESVGYYSLFIAAEAVLIAAFITLSLFTGGEAYNSLLQDPSSRFMDYSIHLGFASAPVGTNIYEFSNMACFPPLSYLLYGFFARLGGYQAEYPRILVSRDAFIGNNLIIFLLYNFMCVLLLSYAVSLYIRKKGFVNQILFPAILIFSYPVAFSSVERGNSVFLVAPMIAIALAWRDDVSKVKRELAMILIAVCAGFKLYPAVLGLLYLKEKRWKEALRLVVYGAVLVFGPFVFFGGLEGMKTFFRILFSTFGEVHDFNIKGIVILLVKSTFGRNTDLFATIVQQLYLVFSLAAFFCARDKRSEVLILCCLMTLYVSSGWMYTCIYIIPAMLIFFSENEGRRIRFRLVDIPDNLAFAMFLAVFSRPALIGGNMFIYGVMCIIASLYNMVVIGAAVNRRFIRPYIEGKFAEKPVSE